MLSKVEQEYYKIELTNFLKSKEIQDLLRSQSGKVKHYDSGRDIKLELDFSINELIITKIKEISVYPILSEESFFEEEDLPEVVWVLDPLDGTFNFSRGLPIYCISIGILSYKVPAFGLIYDFFSNNFYFGSSDIGATMNEQSISVNNVERISDAVLCTGIPLGSCAEEIIPKGEEFCLSDFKKVRMLGSAAMSLAYLASGIVDVYFENGIKIWDITAGSSIVKAAGGRVSIKPLEDYRTVTVLCYNNRIKFPQGY